MMTTLALRCSRPAAPNFLIRNFSRRWNSNSISKGKHFNLKDEDWPEYGMPRPVWTNEVMEDVKITHLPPGGIVDYASLGTVKALRHGYDLITGYHWLPTSENRCLRRVIFLETVAGVPGMVGAMFRHFRSLRKMERDFGWIHTLLEEAENERMHLMMALLLRNPSFPIRAAVLIAQGVFISFYSAMYLISPRYCHRMVGYLEEEAVKTYTKILEDIDAGSLPKFHEIAPAAIRKYYKMPEGSTLRDLFNNIRADEAHHREVNHKFASLKKCDPNPFPPGY